MDAKFMLKAIDVSNENMNQKLGGPFGAVIVKDNKIVSVGANKVTTKLDPTAHAEVEAIRAACTELNTFNLQGCVLYTSCEPCPMCLGAIYWARLDKVFYANTRFDAAEIAGFDDQLIYDELDVKDFSLRQIPLVQTTDLDILNCAKSTFLTWACGQDHVKY